MSRNLSPNSEKSVFACSRTPRPARNRPAKRKSAPPQQPVLKRVAAEDIDRIADAQTVESNTVIEGEFGYIDFDRFPDRRQSAGIQRVEFTVEADAVLRDAPAEVARGLRLIHLDGHTIEEAAQQVKISRFVLKRRMDAFCLDMQAAA